MGGGEAELLVVLNSPNGTYPKP
uniref:Uncharacterized protein n=1 Tax=Arundo donax TaxID=35708 RepID=A0A0A8ZDE5_ARUDO